MAGQGPRPQFPPVQSSLLRFRAGQTVHSRAMFYKMVWKTRVRQGWVMPRPKARVKAGLRKEKAEYPTDGSDRVY